MTLAALDMKALSTVLIVSVILTAIVHVFSIQVEGDYDSEIIPALGDATRLSNGQILHQRSPHASWDVLGSYTMKGKNVELSFFGDQISGDPTGIYAITVHPAFFGLKATARDIEEWGLGGEYVFTRAIFGLNGR